MGFRPLLKNMPVSRHRLRGVLGQECEILVKDKFTEDELAYNTHQGLKASRELMNGPAKPRSPQNPSLTPL
jgi:hypothetical protein